MIYFASLFALVAGALIALQFGVNAALRGFLGSESPFYATFVSYAVGTLASLACLLAVRPALPAWSRVLAVPWWAWTGGLFGAIYIALAVLVVAGQLLASVVFDHFGWVGYAARSFNWWRAFGCVLMIAAVAIIKAH